ncbi:hypothetical protein NUV25_10510 [Burkholderia pseudomultivorans]|uniref:hypothetical protein n=1 Tax=Burkholderia pseudomultivorans TaxID=1207504 RepID=UPI002874005F|nr:hypothetical protein [Burkholderia pseudomultivorans]MDS0858140.1 hypothetical protein [Burkholderia pseudomultivorans]
MGLEICAYREIKKLDCVFDADGDPIDPRSHEPLDYDFRAYVNPDFPERANEIENKGCYVAQESMSFGGG